MTAAEAVVVLVDESDRAVGEMAKLEAHRTGARHRAVSVFVFDNDGRLLLQRRNGGKYHSGGQWANTCCTHPRPGESTADAAHRRLREEMGIACSLEPAGVFSYRCDVGDGLIENEVDHVFIGQSDQTPAPDTTEVQEYRWVALPDLNKELHEQPSAFVPWLKLALKALRRS